MPFHGNTDHEIAGFGHQPSHALALGADNDRRRTGEVGFVQRGRAVRSRAVYPYTVILEGLNGGGKVADAGDLHIFHRARRSLCHHGGKAGAAALGDNYAMGARALRSTDDRAQIVGIRDLVADHDQGRFPLFLCRIQNILNTGIVPCRRHGDYALMRAGLGHGVQLPAVTVGHHRAVLLGKGRNVAEGTVGIAGCDKHLINSAPRLKGLGHGVAALQHIFVDFKLSVFFFHIASKWLPQYLRFSFQTIYYNTIPAIPATGNIKILFPPRFCRVSLCLNVLTVNRKFTSRKKRFVVFTDIVWYIVE